MVPTVGNVLTTERKVCKRVSCLLHFHTFNIWWNISCGIPKHIFLTNLYICTHQLYKPKLSLHLSITFTLDKIFHCFISTSKHICPCCAFTISFQIKVPSLHKLPHFFSPWQINLLLPSQYVLSVQKVHSHTAVQL